MEEYLLSRFARPEFALPDPDATDDPIAVGHNARLKHFLLGITPPVVRSLVQNGMKPSGSSGRSCRHFCTTASSKPWQLRFDRPRSTSYRPAGTRKSKHICNTLCRIDAGREGELWPLFMSDLDRLLCLAGVRSGDHIYLPTAHGRDAYGVRRLIDDSATSDRPRFTSSFAMGSQRSTSRERQSGCEYALVHAN